MSPTSPITKLPLAISSMSLGRAWVHDLDVKLAEAGKAGFQGVEIFWEDLVFAAKKIDPNADERNESDMLGAAQYARDLCEEYGLIVMALQPFMNYEGILDEAKHQEHIVKLKLWFKVVKILGVDMIQIPSQMLSEGTTGDLNRIVADIKELGELGLKEDPPVRFAYEAISWGAHLDLWQKVWDVVLKVDLPNVGTVLDSFHILGRVYADPSSASGIQPDGPTALSESLKELATTPNILSKIFYIQLSDAELMSPPLTPSHPFHDVSQKPRMSWSRNARLFPCETERGGYLPVGDFAKVLFEDLGYRGWVSMEIFSRTMCEPGEEVPKEHAERGVRSWKKLCEELGYN